MTLVFSASLVWRLGTLECGHMFREASDGFGSMRTDALQFACLRS